MGGGDKMDKAGTKTIVQNRQVRHDYFILESYEAGIELFGTEVKSLRAGKANLKDSWCEVKDGELFVRGMHVSPYEQGNIFNRDPLRPRRLLMHKKEIQRLYGQLKTQGLTLIPVSLYLKGSRVKVQVGLCKGKKLYDKRDVWPKKRRTGCGTSDEGKKPLEVNRKMQTEWCRKSGGVMVSTGILKHGKRVEVQDLLKT